MLAEELSCRQISWMIPRGSRPLSRSSNSVTLLDCFEVEKRLSVYEFAGYEVWSTAALLVERTGRDGISADRRCEVLLVSALDGQNVEQLRELLCGRAETAT